MRAAHSRFGLVQTFLRSDPAFMAVAHEWAEQLPIQADSQLRDVRATISPETARVFWQSRNKITNFLKHADRDAKKSISSDEVDNLMLLMQCYGAYQDLTNAEPSNEGLVFELYIRANESQIRDPQSKAAEILTMLGAKPEEERRRICAVFIRELNEGRGAGAD